MSPRVRRLEPLGWCVEASAPAPVTSLEVETLVALLAREPVVLLRGYVPPTRDEMLRFCRRFPGEGILEWDFGPVMEMKVDPQAQNYLFTRERVPFHWDGAFHRVPSYLAFHCLEAPVSGGGGETLFTDTERVWEAASPEDRALWSRLRLTFETEKLAHYGGKISGPLVQPHPRSGRPTLRFAEAVETDKNPVRLTVHGATPSEATGFLTTIGRYAYDRRFCLVHRWERGDFLIADNHRLLHGRNGFTSDSPRHLRRVQVL